LEIHVFYAKFVYLFIFTKFSKQYITIEAGKRSGQPCIRGMRITVGDILGYLASGMTMDEILDDCPKLQREDILAALAYAAAAHNRTAILHSAAWFDLQFLARGCI